MLYQSVLAAILCTGSTSIEVLQQALENAPGENRAHA